MYFSNTPEPGKKAFLAVTILPIDENSISHRKF
jgi:hypothetical protein